MTEHQRGPSEVERLQLDHPDAHIYRELQDGGGHGEWIAELHLTIRCRDTETLRLFIERAYGLGEVARPQTGENAGGDRG